MKKPFVLMLFTLLVFCTASGQVNHHSFWENTPKPIGWVNDFEGLYTDAQEKILDSLIRHFEKNTTIEVAVITLPETATSKDSFDALIMHLANVWGIGKKDQNNGIVIGISKGHRAIRISNGLGIEPLLTDRKTKEIIDRIIIPNFKEGDYFKGTLEGIKQVVIMLEN